MVNRKRLCRQGDTLFDTEHSAQAHRVELPNEGCFSALQPINTLGGIAYPDAFATYTATANAHSRSSLPARTLPLAHQTQTPRLTALISGRTLTAGGFDHAAALRFVENATDPMELRLPGQT
jgi:hypothetical protein